MNGRVGPAAAGDIAASARAHRLPLAALVAAALILGCGLGFALSQSISVPVEVRVVAQKYESGAVEVGVEQDGERYLPDSRFLPSDAETGRWLRSSPVTISVEHVGPETAAAPPTVRYPTAEEIAAAIVSLMTAAESGADRSFPTAEEIAAAIVIPAFPTVEEIADAVVQVLIAWASES